ncbi:hypothetical protein [Sphingobacterium ginsenosidimutans]|uniref:Lipoprotein n=1 Tax=Sphingobacterium ginsenosidimutans TaxID=687845 RepID=A0ABP8A209_9SPHI
MKNARKSYFFNSLFLAVLLVSGCSKSNDNSGNSASPYYFTVNIDGTEKKAENDKLLGMKAQVVFTEGFGNQLLVSGRWRISTIDLKKFGGIDLLIQPFQKKAGVYSTGSSGGFNSVIYWVDMNAEDENEDVYSAGEQGPIGRISVVSFTNEEIRGTFECPVKNANGKIIKLAAGKFYMPVDMSRAR